MQTPTDWQSGIRIGETYDREDNAHLVTINRDPEQYGSAGIEEDSRSLNELLDRWTEAPYDHYDAWLSETYDALEKAGKE